MFRHLCRPVQMLVVLALILTSLPAPASAQTYALTVYNNAGYAGGWCYSNSPLTSNIAASCNDQISSIQLLSGWSVRVYRDQGQGGPSVCLNRSDPNLSDNTYEDGSTLDNTISSFTLYSQAYCGGSPAPAYPLEVSYSGTWCYAPNAEAANIDASCNDQLSSILLRSGWSVRLYRDTNQGGPSTCLTGSDANLTDNTFSDGGPLNDSISSFALYNQPGCPPIDPVPTPTYPLEVYTNPHYTGTRCYSLGAETANIYASCNDQASSLLLQPGWSVRVYRDPNNSGPSACLTAGDSDLGDNLFDGGASLNDAISSFALYQQPACPTSPPPAAHALEVYNDPGYSGWWCYSDAPANANIHVSCADRISSLRLLPGWSVRVFRDPGQSGPNACFTASAPDLRNSTFDNGASLSDTISSFSLYHQASCPPLNTNPETPSEPEPTPTPGAPLSVTYFSVLPTNQWRECAYIWVTLRNNTSSDITQQIVLQEYPAYFTASDSPATRPASQADRARDCATGEVREGSGPYLYQKQVTIPAHGDQSFYFRVAHDWDWIERTSFRDAIRDELLSEVLSLAASKAGLNLLELLDEAGSLALFAQEVADALGAIPIARYTYTLSLPGDTTRTGTVRTEVPATMQGYLRGSIVDTITYQACGYGPAKWAKVLLLPCTLAYFSSVTLYLNAQGPPPWQTMQAAQASFDAAYTELVEPQPIVLDFIATLTDPAQRVYASGYLDAIAQQRAALASYQRAIAAANAGDMDWYTTQLARARQFHAREQAITRGMIDVGDGFLAGLPALSTAQVDALKAELAGAGFDAETSSILSQLDISPGDQRVLSERLSQLDTQDWPLPPDVSVVALRHSEAVEDIANAMRASHSVYLPSVQR